ncbi:hypothetical protein KUTeg_005369 [Tegillarca granosa]|uniref:BRF2-like C-terminal domain-containing protein n=1 Tax=Tegillarca granosa TaxID=220873 RepID=A0ABQ9FJK2_TEGGR|nr:hypothetical protein KUTeg_005369 [Tegillarca granosa]
MVQPFDFVLDRQFLMFPAQVKKKQSTEMENPCCPVCGENAIVDDVSGEHNITVCGECGSILSEFNLTTDGATDVGYQHEGSTVDNFYAIAPKYTGNSIKEYQTKGKVMGKKVAKNACCVLNFTKGMTDYACNLYSEVFIDKEFHIRSLESKKYVSYACVYITIRIFDRPVTLKEFCGIFNLPVYKVAAFMKLICDKLWLSTGRHRDNLITAAVYFAWIADDVVHNKSVTLRDFCKQYSFDFSLTVKKRLKEMKEILTALTHNLPWARYKGRREFVFVNLIDTLRYQKSLIHASGHNISVNENSSIEEESSEEIDSEGIKNKRKSEDLEKENQVFLPPSCKKSK